jgi:hypothetical protein
VDSHFHGNDKPATVCPESFCVLIKTVFTLHQNINSLLFTCRQFLICITPIFYTADVNFAAENLPPVFAAIALGSYADI